MGLPGADRSAQTCAQRRPLRAASAAVGAGLLVASSACGRSAAAARSFVAPAEQLLLRANVPGINAAAGSSMGERARIAPLAAAGVAAAALGAAGATSARPRPRAAPPASASTRIVLRASAEDAVKKEEGKQRPVRIEYEGTVETDILKGDVPSMDAFMKENAQTVCIQNVERIEPTPDGDPTVKYCYLEPSDVGPFRSQMRLTLKVVVADTKRVDMKILEMMPGNVDKKTGEVTLSPENAPKFQTSNFVTWEDNGSGGLKLVNRSTAVTVQSLPWWFPVPDSLVKKLVQFFISKVISKGQEGVTKQIDKQYSEWMSANQYA